MFSYLPTNNIQISQFILSFCRHDHYHYHYDHCDPLDVYHIAFVVFFFNRSKPVEQENNKSNIDTNLQTGHTDNVHAHVYIML